MEEEEEGEEEEREARRSEVMERIEQRSGQRRVENEFRSIGGWCGGKGRYAKTGGAAVRDLVRSGTRIFIYQGTVVHQPKQISRRLSIQ